MSQAAQKEIRGEPAGEVPVRLAARVGVADSLAGRLKGLLGRSLHEDEGLFIAPCSSVHTMGMSYPLDIVFVDTDARAVALYPDLKPWRATRWVPGACGALELPAGTLAKAGLRIGDKVEVPGPLRRSVRKGFGANLVLGAFWLFLAVNMVPALLAGDAGPSAYMLFAVNSLIAVLFLTRREEIRVTESSRDRLVTVVCVLLSFSLRPAAGAALVSPVWGSSLLTVSLLFVFAAYLNLGRSFGLIPADRGLKLQGMYGWIRHPLYGGEMLFFVSFLLVNFTLRNIIFIAGIFLSLHMRALAEERLLARDPVYDEYCRRIRKRYIPYLV